MGRKMILGMALTSNYGAGTFPDTWRMPVVDPANYAKVDSSI